jgi:flagellar hook-basal body complex protein FliE
MNPIASVFAADPGIALQPAGAGGGPAFSQWIEQQLSGVDTQLQKSDRLVQDLALGKVDNLHHVMIEMEKSKLSLQLLLQVRNHVLDAYQELVRMQL